MKSRRISWVVALVACAASAALACGGSTAGVPDANGTGSDGGPTDGATGSDGAATDGGGATDGGKVGDASTAECAKLRQELDALEDKALECCPTCRSLQCHVLTDSLCCPISTTGDKPEYAAAVKRYRAECGPPPCPPVVCQDMASNVCDPVPGKPDNVGRCRAR
jgi:hypothetical protein